MHNDGTLGKFLFIISLLFLGVFATVIFAQEESSKEKLKNIKGDVNKITITTDKGDVVFEGEDAQKLFKKMNYDR